MDVKRCCLTNNISFRGKIIDSHAHIGHWSADKADYRASGVNNLIQDTFEINVNGHIEHDRVESILASSMSCLDMVDGKPYQSELEGNQALIDECNGMPKIKPLAVCQPGYGNSDNIESLLKFNLGRVYGFKFHPMCLGINANDQRYLPYMKLAEKYKLPCVFHSDAVGSFADPNLIYELAQKTPKVPVVLYHMSLAPAGKVGELPAEEIKRRGLVGQEDKYIWEVREKWNNEGISVAQKALRQKDANLYVDVSWTKPETVIHAIKKLGADRVLFGTDSPLGKFINREDYAKNIAEIKQAIKAEFNPRQAEVIINKVFYANANELFFEKNWAKNMLRQAVRLIQRTPELVQSGIRV